MKKLLIAILVILIIVIPIFSLLYNQKTLIREAQMVQIMGKPLMAVNLYERVLLNYVPFSPYNKKAIEGIENICISLTDKKYKLFCEETLRSSLYQIRSFYTPYNDKIREIDKRILLLKTELYIEQNRPPEDKFEAIYKDLKNMQEFDYNAQVSWSLIAVLSLLLWIGCLNFAIFSGFTKPVNKKNLQIGLAGFLIFFTLWIIGLIKA